MDRQRLFYTKSPDYQKYSADSLKLLLKIPLTFCIELENNLKVHMETQRTLCKKQNADQWTEEKTLK
jgi:hypothetical protein